MELEFGAMCPPLKEQLEKQRLPLTEPEYRRFQRIADAIVTLKIAQIIPDSVVESSNQKLMKKIVSALEAKAE